MTKTFCFMIMTAIALINLGFWMERSEEKRELQQQVDILHADQRKMDSFRFPDGLTIVEEEHKQLLAQSAHNKKVSFIQSEVNCLADNIYREANGEPEEGQLAVATVVMNRVSSPKYPKTVCGVVYERHIKKNSDTIVCMFSWACKPNEPKQTSEYQKTLTLARQVYFKHKRNDEIEDATMYHAAYINPPNWAVPENVVATIGTHIFYKQ